MNEHPETLENVATVLEAGTGKEILDGIRLRFERFVSVEQGLAEERYAQASEAAASTAMTTRVLALISVIFGGAVAVRIGSSISKPVRTLSLATGKVSKGDVHQAIVRLSNDEIGDLSVAFNQMVMDLRELDETRSHAVESLHQRSLTP